MNDDLTILEEALATLLSRRSVSPKRLTSPAPDLAELDLMIQAALRAPDHGGLHPWRIVEFRDTEREALALCFEQEKLRRDPLASPSDLAKAREHATRPPVLLGFVVSPRARTKVPLREQMLAAGAALGNLLNAAHQLGYGASILSGERCFDTELLHQLGIGAEESLAGFVSIGTIREAPPPARQVLSPTVWSCWMPGLRADQRSMAAPLLAKRAVDLALSTAGGAEPAIGVDGQYGSNDPNPMAASDLTFEEAREALRSRLLSPTETEAVTVAQALGRVLALDVVSPIDVPAHDNAAMDGYALHGEDLALAATAGLQAVAGTALAGTVFDGIDSRGQCVRIMTGAAMPSGLDTVAPLEACSVEGCSVTVGAGAVHHGDHWRRQGEDLRAGTVALAARRRLRPAELGLIASLGLEQATVFRRLRVALISTGDEVQAPGKSLAAGQIYDSNRYGLLGALQGLGVEVVDLGCRADDPVALDHLLARETDKVDVVISTGGVGAGDADHVGALLRERGEIVFSHVAIRPGRPLTVGRLRRGDKDFLWHFALPGNPVAALVTFHVLVRDALLSLSGAAIPERLHQRARSVDAIRKRPGRTEFQRGVVAQGVDGVLEVRSTGAQGSGVLRSLSEANALIVLGHDQGPIAAGDSIEVWMLDDKL